MRHRQTWTFAAALAAGLATAQEVVIIGQPPGAGKDGAPPAIRFGGPGGMPGFPAGFKMPAFDPAGEKIALLELPELQKELALNADEKAGLGLLLEELKAGAKKYAEEWDKLKPEDIGAQMGKRVGERNAEAKKLIDEGLGPKAARFKAIGWQLDGLNRSLADPEVGKALDVTAAQRTQIMQAVRAGFGPPMGGGAVPAFSFGNGPPTPEKMREMMEGMRKKMDDAALSVLSDAQKKKWSELVGAAVSFQKPAPKMPAFPAFGGPPAIAPPKTAEAAKK